MPDYSGKCQLKPVAWTFLINAGIFPTLHRAAAAAEVIFRGLYSLVCVGPGQEPQDRLSRNMADIRYDMSTIIIINEPCEEKTCPWISDQV